MVKKGKPKFLPRATQDAASPLRSGVVYGEGGERWKGRGGQSIGNAHTAAPSTPKPNTKLQKLSTKLQKTSNKLFFCYMSRVNQAAKPPKSFGNWHRQRQSQSASLPHLKKKPIQGISGRAARKRAIQGGARVPDFDTLQSGEKHGKRYIA